MQLRPLGLCFFVLVMSLGHSSSEKSARRGRGGRGKLRLDSVKHRSDDRPRQIAAPRVLAEDNSLAHADNPIETAVSALSNVIGTIDVSRGHIDRLLTWSDAFRPASVSPALFDAVVLAGVFLVAHFGNRVIVQIVSYLISLFGDLVILIALAMAYFNIHLNANKA